MSDCATHLSRRHAFLDGELPDTEEAEVRAHLEACDHCRRDFARERAFLDAVAAAGRETAPPELRRRVEAVLESGGGVTASGGPGWRAWGLLAAAAAVALLLVVSPWDGADRPTGAGVAAVAFAADHVAHAESAPSGAPLPPSAAPAPPLAAGEVMGLSRCVIEGRAYAHFTYRAEGATVSVFVPLDGAAPPAGTEAAVETGGTRVAVVAVEAEGGRPAAVLVSDGLAAPALERFWHRG